MGSLHIPFLKNKTVEMIQHTRNNNLIEVGQMFIKNGTWWANLLSHFRLLRTSHAESQILVTHSHLTHFYWSVEQAERDCWLELVV